MGHSKAEKEETHKRIVRIAAKRFRENGLAGIGLAELMKEAGLTVGGFYKHFDSRDDLVAKALDAAFHASTARIEAARVYSNAVDEYLSEAHRDSPGTGCALGALTSELARTDETTRQLATDKIRNDIQSVAALIHSSDPAAARSKAILTISAFVGALGLSRTVSDPELSREILNSVAMLLKGITPDR